MTIKPTFYILLSVSLLTSVASAQQHCNDYLDKTTDSKLFTFKDGGQLIFDQRTGLTWQRCLVGQTFNNNKTPTVFTDDSCDGQAEPYTRIHALQYVNKQKDYRLPNIKELASITELQCTNPAINQSVFANQPNNWVWSSTPILFEGKQAIMSINFTTGNGGVNGAENSLIRLIKK